MLEAPEGQREGAEGKGGPGAKRLATVIVSVAVSALLIGFLLEGVPGDDLGRAAREASLPGLALYAALAVAGLCLRAHRFRMLMAPAPIGMLPILLVTLAQNCLTDLVPGRLASFGSYVVLLVRRFRLRFETAASAFVVSFAFDLATLGPFLVLAGLSSLDRLAPGPRSRLPLGWTVASGAVFFLVVAALTYQLGPITRIAVRWIGVALASAGLHERALAKRIVEKLELIAGALSEVRRGGLLARAFLVSVAIRLAKYLSLYVLAGSFLGGTGSNPAPIGFSDFIIAISATELLASLPIPSIGQFGVWEGGMSGVLVFLGYPREGATIAAFGLHVTTQAFEYLLGIGAILALGLLGRGEDSPMQTS